MHSPARAYLHTRSNISFAVIIVETDRQINLWLGTVALTPAPTDSHETDAGKGNSFPN